jgi:hypothetical protein
MDMFVYGCPNIIKFISLLNHTFVHYDLTNILKELDICQEMFSKICVLSGTDYNIATPFTMLSLHEIFNYYYKYKNIDNLIDNNEYFNKIYGMFKMIVSTDNIIIKKNNVSFKEIKHNIDIFNILKLNGFIFPKNYLIKTI